MDQCRLTAVTSLAVILLRVVIQAGGDTNGITMSVFGGIGAALSPSDRRRLRMGGIRGNRRAAKHFTKMLVGTIATVTAFVVTSLTFQPEFVLWLMPTLVITPIIVWGNFRILAGRTPMGMPQVFPS